MCSSVLDHFRDNGEWMYGCMCITIWDTFKIYIFPFWSRSIFLINFCREIKIAKFLAGFKTIRHPKNCKLKYFNIHTVQNGQTSYFLHFLWRLFRWIFLQFLWTCFELNFADINQLSLQPTVHLWNKKRLTRLVFYST